MAQEVLQGKDTATERALYMSFELADKAWKLTFGNWRERQKCFRVAAGDTQAVLQCIAKARARFGLPPDARVYSCYEAGRDGWWLHRWLKQHDVANIVVDASSIEVARRRRRAKTDRRDGEKLLRLLLRYYAGEQRVWSVVREPTPEQEDARRPQRELSRLIKERTQHSNRIGSLLVLHNLRGPHIGTRRWQSWWDAHREQVPALLRAEIEREVARLALVDRQLGELRAAQRQAVGAGQQPLVAQLSMLRAIGLRSASVLTAEQFGWRDFANRRQVGACFGLDPTPYSSGDSCTEQGISKAGNRRSRSLMVELAWRWLRLQRTSALSAWFEARFAHGGRRMRRIGIVALARKLAIALWRFLKFGEIPAGAVLKGAQAAA
jgi:transposase